MAAQKLTNFIVAAALLLAFFVAGTLVKTAYAKEFNYAKTSPHGPITFWISSHPADGWVRTVVDGYDNNGQPLHIQGNSEDYGDGFYRLTARSNMEPDCEIVFQSTKGGKEFALTVRNSDSCPANIRGLTVIGLKLK